MMQAVMLRGLEQRMVSSREERDVAGVIISSCPGAEVSMTASKRSQSQIEECGRS